MKKKKRSKKKSRRPITIRASAEKPHKGKRKDHFLELYKPRKRRITVRLDADVLEWFQKGGRGYQTRINRALRAVMRKEQG